jgi:hypothetical protein
MAKAFALSGMFIFSAPIASATSAVPALRLCTARLNAELPEAQAFSTLYGNALDLDLAEDDLARNRDLSLQRAVGHARVVGEPRLLVCSRHPGAGSASPARSSGCAR